MAKILLVEDDNNLREIYEARLEAEGYEVVAAQNGEEALVVAKKERPELIISDVMMPKISGFEMLDILRNTDGLKDAKVIMLTALGQDDDRTRADKLGADRYLVKSQVTLEDIVKAVRSLLEGPSSSPPAEAVPAAPAPVADISPTPPPAAPTVPDPSPQQPTTPAARPQSAPAAPRLNIAVATPPAAPANGSPVSVSVAAPPPESAPVSTPTAPPQDASPSPAPSPPANPSSPAPVVASSDLNSANASNDQVLSDAIKGLTLENQATDSKPRPQMPSDVQAVEVPPAENLPSAPGVSISATSNAMNPEPAASSASGSDQPDNNNVTVAHKKVITPPESSPKPSLEELLSVEEAQEQAAAPNNDPVVVSDNQPKVDEANQPSPPPSNGIVAPSQPPDGLNPNDIAL